jgi:thiol-disulfide isomerase/thioredoxin
VISRMPTRLALIIGILALLGIGASCDSSGPSEAPDFTLPTLTGGNVTLSELQGTLVVLNFWSISCSFCRQQLPYLENVAQQTEGQIEVIAVNTVDSAENVQSFFGEYQPTMTVVLDENAEVFVNYCQNFDNSRGYIPFTLFIDSEGLVQYKRIGAFASEEALWDALHDIFGITVP